jgi:DNA-binding transcriptional MerR regulator
MSPAERTYRIAAFAALAGVTPRALRHYDRLGLLKPRRSTAGYRIYSERDLETLEEIVALKFIGVPLKQIAAIRRQPRGSFADVLRAQRQTLEEMRRRLTQAIAAIAAAEAPLRAGHTIDDAIFRKIIEVMHMDNERENSIATYMAMLKQKMTHISALSADARADLHEQWSALAADVKGAVDADPAGPVAQALLDRWLALLQTMTGTPPADMLRQLSTPFRMTPELRDEIGTRMKSEWWPELTTIETLDPAAVEDAAAHARERANAFADRFRFVVEFMKRARAARG